MMVFSTFLGAIRVVGLKIAKIINTRRLLKCCNLTKYAEIFPIFLTSKIQNTEKANNK